MYEFRNNGSQRQSAASAGAGNVHRKPSITIQDNRNLSHNGILQRKVLFSGIDLEGDSESLRLSVVSAFVKNQEKLLEMYPERYEILLAEIKKPSIFKLIINDMVKSPRDYGEINLENPQHVLLFFKDLDKFSMANYKSQEKEESGDKSTAEFDESIWKIKKEYSPDKELGKENTFKVALLGTSASVAYYIGANGASLEPKSTVTIGKGKPWSPYDNEGRGITFVNHPKNMISPDRQKTHLPSETSGADETFEGNAWGLANDSIKKIKQFTNHINAQIISVTRQKYTGWYIIETSEGMFYAEKVVAGLGIGPHRKPRNSAADQITSDDDKKAEKQRVMDLDTFQRELKNPNSDMNIQHEKNGFLRIGVAGPNAGVDAVFEATNRNMFVSWVVSGGPAVVEGMGNKVSKKGWVDLYFDYLNGWSISGDRVQMSMTGKWRDKEGATAAEQQLAAETAFQQKSPGWTISQNKSVNVDYMVYAQGPDVSQVYDKIFDKDIRDSLELQYDSQDRISSSGDGESIEVRTSASEYNVYWEGINKRIGNVLKDASVIVKNSVSRTLEVQAKEILGVETFTNIAKKESSAIGLASEDGSFEIIGGSIIRVLNLIDGAKAGLIRKEGELNGLSGFDPEFLVKREKIKSDIERLKSKIPPNLDSGETSKAVDQIQKTLSSPTVVASDQLTPIRAQIEARAESMPGYIGMEESNFVTDDQTMIAAQIAGYYANIPGTLANWVTQKIIEDRNKNGVKPGTNEGSRAFVDKWKTKLEHLQVLFSRETITAKAQME